VVGAEVRSSDKDAARMEVGHKALENIFKMLAEPAPVQQRLNESFATMDDLEASLKRHGWERIKK